MPERLPSSPNSPSDPPATFVLFPFLFSLSLPRLHLSLTDLLSVSWLWCVDGAVGEQLVRQRFTAEYLGTSEQEINLLVERWASEECMAAIMQFFANQKTKGPKAKL